MTGVRLVDGSGLSRRTRLTPAALATVLQRVQREPWFADFSAALPVAGNPDRMVGGTLRSRMTGTAAAEQRAGQDGQPDRGDLAQRVRARSRRATATCSP